MASFSDDNDLWILILVLFILLLIVLTRLDHSK